MRHKVAAAIVCALGWLSAVPHPGLTVAHARTAPAALNPCDAAAAKAARSSGVPVDLLMAIARVETGRSRGGVLSPWPWTVNQAGAGSFFDTAAEAMDHVSRAMAAGESNIDIGCFQINIHWHGAGFASLQAMFDPTENALYAARFLLRLQEEFGNWDAAIGTYHSRQSGAATAYLAKVSALMDGSLPATPGAGIGQIAARDNRYPLLQPGRTAGYGSLVATAFDHPAIPLLR